MNKWSKAIAAIQILIAVLPAKAQTTFIKGGRITFERRTNQHALLDENNQFYAHRKSYPQFISCYYQLSFNNEKSLYQPSTEANDACKKMFGIFDTENVVAGNLSDFTCVTQKKILDENFIVADTLKKVEWKMMGEVRTIAGFNCRKAVGKIFDSVVVIAFYTDEVTARGGPESFCGLPGMILGIAVPRLHTTWYATKVELIDIKSADLTPPSRGKKYTAAEFRQQAIEMFTEPGQDLDRLLWQNLL